MHTIHLAGLTFGSGLPKICVPLTAGDLPGLKKELDAARALPAGLFEWRVDCFRGDAAPALGWLKEEAFRPLLVTLRTKGQGGGAVCGREEYESRLLELLELGGFQLLDIEFSWGDSLVSKLIEAAHGKGVGAVVSYHDFEETPDQPWMVSLLTRMKALGADLPKLAVTPGSPRDVLALMEATREASEKLGPVITMSMGELGRLSRISGGLTGSCVTFGAGAGGASAPGQISAARLSELLEEFTPREKGESL